MSERESLVHVQVRLPADLVRRLDALTATDTGGVPMTRSQVMRRALGRGVVLLEREQEDQNRRAKQLRIAGT